jgi:hypothetical protein
MHGGEEDPEFEAAVFAEDQLVITQLELDARRVDAGLSACVREQDDEWVQLGMFMRFSKLVRSFSMMICRETLSRSFLM